MKVACKSVIIACALAACGTSFAGSFPDRPVTLVVPYSAGQIDAFARALAKGMSDAWKQPVIVDNRGGGNEVVGADAVARSAPTGYTILIATEATYILNPILFKKLPYLPEKLTPVSITVMSPFVVMGSPSNPANTMKELVEQARNRTSDPVKYGSVGQGSLTHLPFAKLALDNKIELLHIPYKGGAAVITDLMGSTIDVALMGAGIAAPQVKAGKIKPLGVASPERIDVLPDVPTLKEQGFPDFSVKYILGLSVPAGTPPSVIRTIEETSRKVVTAPEFRLAFLTPMGYTAVGSTPQAFADYLKDEKPRLKAQIDQAGIKPQ
jgi:tripartite-type tricarboxylate transporter receptor subunit TctC